MSDSVKDEQGDGLNKIQPQSSMYENSSAMLSNNYHAFIVRKSERLASALYVITGFIPEAEPMRARLRVCAVELITRSSSPAELAEGGAEKFENRCTEIATLLETAQYAGLISEMNARLLSEEYAALAAFVRRHAGKIAERGHMLKKSSVSEPRSLVGSIRHPRRSLLRKSVHSDTSAQNRTSNVLENRKSTILSLFDTKKEISIKDAVSLIPGVSEKTVQRDLLSLVSDGVLTKRGERRWTVYQKV